MSERKKYLEWIIVGFPIVSFLLFKIFSLDYRFGDGNAYVYMAKALLDGIVPYRDYFLADPPFMVVFLAPLYVIFQNHLLFFQLVPVIFECLTAFFLYRILKKWQVALSPLVVWFYLLSFTVLSVSDYFTGIQLVVFFSVIGFYFWISDRPIFSGVAFALAMLTKLYSLPIFFGAIVYILLTRSDAKKIQKLLLSYVLTGTVFMLPFVVTALPKVWQYLVVHQFHRPPGLDKWRVWNFFLNKEWLLILLGLGGVFCISRGQKLFDRESPNETALIVLPFFFSAIFLLMFQDIYYLYLEILLPFFCLGAVLFLNFLRKKLANGNSLVSVLIFIYVIFSFYTLFDYRSSFQTVARFSNAKEVSEVVRELPEKFDVYGSHEVAPLLALLSDRKVFGNYIDTNGQAFASGGQDLKKVTEEAVSKGVYFLAKVTDLPELGVNDFGFDAYFDRSYFEYCTVAHKFPSTSGEQDNILAVYRCKKN